MDCIFCKVVKGEIDSAKIWEDEQILAFLDVNPVTKGHCLVIPKEHFENIFDINEDILKEIIVAAKNISEKIREYLGAKAIRISQSNGKLAGQAIFHFHLHIIPRYEDDGVSMNETANLHPSKADFNELKKLAQGFRDKS